MGDAMGASDKNNSPPRSCGQIVLVLQGGGALGAYQAGVYQALHEHGIEPDWVIGTSIGAINASLIAGNAPEHRVNRLLEFWSRINRGFLAESLHELPFTGPALATMATAFGGVGGFFRPNPRAWLGPHHPLGAEAAGYYCTDELAETLTELVDFNLLNQGAPRVTVGAANVGTGEMRYFDSRSTGLTLKHVMASGALPPAFPAIRIDGELYWDGGILSNTPVEAVFDDNPRRDSLVFAVHIWNPDSEEPDTLWKVFGRQKDLQYASRAKSQIARQRQLHRLRHIIAELAKRIPEEDRSSNMVREMAAYGCLTRMHVVRLLAPPFMGDDHAKDIDFSPRTVRTRWQAGYEEARRVLERRPWEGEFDPLEGFILHEGSAGEMMAAQSAAPRHP
jgi:NTE family protein